MRCLGDTWLLFVRNLKATLRNPAWVIMGLFQPIVYLLLFAPLLRSIGSAPGFPPGGTLTVFTAGILITLGILSTAFAGFGLIGDLRAGVTERLRVTPVSRAALLLGSVLRDVVLLLAQSLLLVLVAWLLGLRADPIGVVLALALMGLIGLFMAACSYGLALALKNENALAATVNFFAQPLLLLSGIMLPLTLAPPTIRAIATFNPFAYAVDASRALFIGNIADGAVLRGFAIMAVLALLALRWAGRSLSRATN